MMHTFKDIFMIHWSFTTELVMLACYEDKCRARELNEKLCSVGTMTVFSLFWLGNQNNGGVLGNIIAALIN